MRRSAAVLLAILLAPPGASASPRRSADSGPTRVALLELYTSEGCSSCPPADAWLSAHKDLIASGRAAALALHVDYWDYIGWADPFSQAAFSERQRRQAARAGGGAGVYTPQLLVDGRDASRGELDRALARAAASSPGATIHLELADEGAAQEVTVRAALANPAHQGKLFVALYEQDLVSEVHRGENGGRTLRHDFVVRRLIGPLALGESHQRIAIAPGWKRGDLGVVAFVEDPSTGEVLQALHLPPDRRAASR